MFCLFNLFNEKCSLDLRWINLHSAKRQDKTNVLKVHHYSSSEWTCIYFILLKYSVMIFQFWLFVWHLQENYTIIMEKISFISGCFYASFDLVWIKDQFVTLLHKTSASVHVHMGAFREDSKHAMNEENALWLVCFWVHLSWHFNLRYIWNKYFRHSSWIQVLNRELINKKFSEERTLWNTLY